MHMTLAREPVVNILVHKTPAVQVITTFDTDLPLYDLRQVFRRYNSV